jgi:hypothetical protein
MTLEGGGGGILETVGNVIGGTIEAVGQGIVDAGSSVNNFVKEEVPGGWATVAAVAVPYAAPMVTGTALTVGQAAALAAGTSAVTGAIQGKDPEDILKSAALSAAGSYLGGSLSDSGVPNWDADITAGAEGYANAAGAGAGSGLSADMNLDAPYVDMPDGEYLLNTPTDQGGLPSLNADIDLDAPHVDTPDGEYLLNTPTDQGGLPDWDADITAGAEGYEEAGGLPQYPGDSQYIEQDLQEQARNTDVPSGSSTSWDRGDSSLPSAKEALKAANRARQVYNMLSGVGGTMVARNVPGLGQYTTPTTTSDLGGLSNFGIPNLTAGIVRGQPIDLNIDQFNSPLSPVNAAEGGYIQNYAEAGEVDSYKDTNYQDTVTGLAKLRPNLIRGKSDFGLQKYWNAPATYADGGSIEGHNPEFFSEGGLQNRYVKGDGDGTSDDVPAMLANGEFVIPADVVSSLGNGSNDSGAHLLDEFLQVIREHKRNADSRELPPDSKGPLGYLLEAKRKAR